MKAFLILALCVLAVTAIPAPIPTNEAGRVNGENGWYVPQLDGSFTWMDMKAGEDLVESMEQVEERGLSTAPVHFYLFTSANPTKSQKISNSDKSISASSFNPRNPTRIVIHGWTQSNTAGMNKDIRNAFLSHGDHNVIIVDWARARGEYATAVSAVSTVGKKVASLVDSLVRDHGMSLNDLYVIGHSLGAHVAGYTGKNVKSGQVHTIVGLDPALPLFNYKKTKKRLSSEDAYYVESIQTNGGTLGFLKPIGKSAFYPNGGQTQPGCPLDVTGACSHGRSTTYYAEAVSRDNFGSIKCSDYEKAVANKCGSTFSSTRMGAGTNAYIAAGHFYVPVNSKAPHGVIN